MNVEKLAVADLLLVCQQQTESDSMVLFLRAITAASFMTSSADMLSIMEGLTDSDG